MIWCTVCWLPPRARLTSVHSENEGIPMWQHYPDGFRQAKKKCFLKLINLAFLPTASLPSLFCAYYFSMDPHNDTGNYQAGLGKLVHSCKERSCIRQYPPRIQVLWEGKQTAGKNKLKTKCTNGITCHYHPPFIQNIRTHGSGKKNTHKNVDLINYLKFQKKILQTDF